MRRAGSRFQPDSAIVARGKNAGGSGGAGAAGHEAAAACVVASALDDEAKETLDCDFVTIASPGSATGGKVTAEDADAVVVEPCFADLVAEAF